MALAFWNTNVARGGSVIAAAGQLQVQLPWKRPVNSYVWHAGPGGHLPNWTASSAQREREREKFFVFRLRDRRT